jgi:hypothetical protein
VIDNSQRRGRGLVGRHRRPDALASLTDLDRRLLSLLCEQRVLTQTQLECLHPDVPDRTLRYRTERLTRLGLVGRSRPYREKGSAPFHYWPTRASDAFVRGDPLPRGGERAAPNPQFLDHAERLSELYVLLTVQAPTVGLRLHNFKRERDAREAFRADGRERALAPDALIQLRDDQDRELLGFVELDLGTMSHTRLRTKAAGYAAYAANGMWEDRHPFCPCLLFLTTTEMRAIAFVKMLVSLLEKQGRGSYYGNYRRYRNSFAAAACAHARDAELALVEACWDDLALAGGGLTLADCLNKARVGYDQTLAKQQAEREARERQREHLRTNSEARRTYLQEHPIRFHGHLDQFGATGATALALLLASSEPMNETERDAFDALVRQLDDDPLKAKPAPAPAPPSWSETQAVELLVELYQRRQRQRLKELTARYGEGPTLRRYRRDLDADQLFGPASYAALDERARRDHEGRREQERLRLAYLDRRDREARQRKREAGLASRLAQGAAAMYPVIDQEQLRICRRCDEIAYPPKPHRDQHGYQAAQSYREPTRCHFCGGSDLAAWDPAFQPRLEFGPAEADLTSAGIAGSMQSHDNDEEVYGR